MPKTKEASTALNLMMLPQKNRTVIIESKWESAG
jgi:hypothetical protein